MTKSKKNAQNKVPKLMIKFVEVYPSSSNLGSYYLSDSSSSPKIASNISLTGKKLKVAISMRRE